MIRLLLPVLACVLSLVATANVSAASSSEKVVSKSSAAKSYSISVPRIRALPPGVKNTAAYFTIKNLTKSDVQLVAVDSPVAGSTMIHKTTENDGKLGMEHQDSVTIKAGKRVKFKPRGLHIMLMDLKKHLTIGEQVPLTLRFSDGSERTVKANVQKNVAETGNLSG